MKVFARNAAGAVLGNFVIPATGEVEVPKDLTKHQAKILGSWIKTGVIGDADAEKSAKAEAEAKAKELADAKAKEEAEAKAKAKS